MSKNFIKSEIIKHAQSVSEEVCGLIVFDMAHKKPLVIPMENMAEDRVRHFRLSSQEYLDIYRQYKILAVYHSHFLGGESEESLLFSETDKTCSKLLALPMVLYSVGRNRFNMLTPDTYVMEPLLGREYVWGFWDCYTLIKDYWTHEYGYTYGCYNFLELDDVSLLREGDFFERHIHKLDKTKITKKRDIQDISHGDIMFFTLRGKFIDHAGIYLDGNKLLHQPLGGLSQVINLDERWIRKFKIGISYNDKS